MKKFVKLSKTEMKTVLGGGPNGTGPACVAACQAEAYQTCSNSGEYNCVNNFLNYCVPKCAPLAQQ
jgi:hypothetical protein